MNNWLRRWNHDLEVAGSIPVLSAASHQQRQQPFLIVSGRSKPATTSRLSDMFFDYFS